MIPSAPLIPSLRRIEEEDAREEARLRREQDQQRLREQQEAEAARQRKAKEEAQAQVERAWEEAARSQQKKHRERPEPAAAPEPMPMRSFDQPRRQASSAVGDYDDDDDDGGFEAAPGVSIAMPKRRRPVAKPQTPPALAERVGRGSRPPSSTGRDPQPAAAAAAMGAGPEQAGHAPPVRRGVGPGPATQEAIAHHARLAAQQEFERLQGQLQRQQGEMAQLQHRALRAELEGERAKAELWELHLDRSREQTISEFLRGEQPPPPPPMPDRGEIPLGDQSLVHDIDLLGLDSLGPLKSFASPVKQGGRAGSFRPGTGVPVAPGGGCHVSVL